MHVCVCVCAVSGRVQDTQAERGCDLKPEKPGAVPAPSFLACDLQAPAAQNNGRQTGAGSRNGMSLVPDKIRSSGQNVNHPPHQSHCLVQLAVLCGKTFHYKGSRTHLHASLSLPIRDWRRDCKFHSSGVYKPHPHFNHSLLKKCRL